MNIIARRDLICIVILCTSIFGCKDDEVEAPVQLVINGNVESGSSDPNGWWYSDGLGKYEIEWTEQESVSTKKSLKISTTTSVQSDFAFWSQTITTNLPVGKSVTLNVKVKGDLTGTGVSIAIRGDNTILPEGSGEQFATTQGSLPIAGDFDWKNYSVKLDALNADIKSLTLYLIFLPNTSGEVYFDDVSLTY